MRVIFTCGGTAGHVNPAIALAGLLQQRVPGTEVLFVGARNGMESRLVPREGYAFESVDISGVYRSVTPAAIRHNVGAVKNLLRSPAQAKKIIQTFRPDLVVGTGGYASYPVIRCASRMKIPTAVHESNAVPGLTTRMLEKHVDRVMVGFEACRQHYHYPDKVVVTGTPVRGDFFRMSKRQARQVLGIQDDRPLIVSFWGSLGASVMNRQMLDFLEQEARERRFHHIHAVGRAGYQELKQQAQQRGVTPERCPDIQLRDYIYDMPTVMRAADLVLCRAGASTISELTALAVPAVMVPSPYVTNNHQEKNAMVLVEAGAAVMLREAECNGALLYRTAREILSDPVRRSEMSAAMGRLGIPQAAEEICDLLLSLCK